LHLAAPVFARCEALGELQRSRQRCFCLGNASAHNLAYRQDFIKASDDLAPPRALILTACPGLSDLQDG
jgi:hypothetical protein